MSSQNNHTNGKIKGFFSTISSGTSLSGIFDWNEQLYRYRKNAWPNNSPTLAVIDLQNINGSPDPGTIKLFRQNTGDKIFVEISTITNGIYITPALGSLSVLKYSPDGTYLATGSEVANSGQYLRIHKRNGYLQFTASTTIDTQPGVVYSMAWDPTGVYLAVAHGTSPYINVYKRSNDAFTKLANPYYLPSSLARSVTWTTDSTRLVVGNSASPFITVYRKLADDTLIKSDWTGVAADTPYVTMMSADSNFFLIGGYTGQNITGHYLSEFYAPNEGVWSNFFLSTGYLTVSTSTAFNYGTSDFTIEGWFRLNSTATTQTIFDTATLSNVNSATSLTVSTTRALQLKVGTTSTVSTSTAINAITTGTWNHFAVARYQGGFSLWLNGAYQVRAGTNNTYYNPSAITVGTDYTKFNALKNGNISNFRITSGQALVTATTVGSVFFNGYGDYLSIANTSTLNLSNASFTAECWFYATSSTSNATLFNKDGVASTSFTQYSIELRNNVVTATVGTGNGTGAGKSNTAYGNAVATLNSWTHVALQVNSATNLLSIYVNGVLNTSTAVQQIIDGGRALLIGWQTNQGLNTYWPGYISNLRITKGSTIYSGSTFLVPTTEFTTSTFYSYGVSFNGTNQYLQVPYNSAFLFSALTFTIEAWIYPLTASVSRGIACTWNIGGAWQFYVNSSNVLAFAFTSAPSGASTTLATGSTTITAGVWTHVVVQRNTSNMIQFYINGTVDPSSTSVAGLTMYFYNGAAKDLYVGVSADTGGIINGIISNLRIVRGLDVYTGNFLPPLNALSNAQSATTNTNAVTNVQTLFLLSGNVISDLSTSSFSITNNNTATISGVSLLALQKYGDLLDRAGRSQTITAVYTATVTTVTPFTITTPSSFTVSTSSLTTSTVGHSGGIVAPTITGNVVLLTCQNSSIKDSSTVSNTVTPISNAQAYAVAIATPFTGAGSNYTYVPWRFATPPVPTINSTYRTGGAKITDDGKYIFLGGSPTASTSSFRYLDWFSVNSAGTSSSLTILSNTAIPPHKLLSTGTQATLGIPYTIALSPSDSTTSTSWIALYTGDGDSSITVLDFKNDIIGNGPNYWSTYYSLNSNSLDPGGTYISGVALKQHFTTTTQSFTIEFWKYRIGGDANDRHGHLLIDSGTAQTAGYVNPRFIALESFSIVIYNTLYSNVFDLGDVYKWMHVALTFNGTTLTVYKNGTNVWSTATSFTTALSNAGRIWIGMEPYNAASAITPSTTNGYKGYISNFRISKKVVYTGNFAPSPDYLTSSQNSSTNIQAITTSECVLLTNLRSTSVDSSWFNNTVTNVQSNGEILINTWNPFLYSENSRVSTVGFDLNPTSINAMTFYPNQNEF